MEYSPFWQANSFSSGNQETPRIWHSKFRFRPWVRRTKSIPYHLVSWTHTLIFFPRLRLDIPSILFPSRFPATYCKRRHTLTFCSLLLTQTPASVYTSLGKYELDTIWNVRLRLHIASYRLTHRLLLRHEFHLQFKYFGGATEWLT